MSEPSPAEPSPAAAESTGHQHGHHAGGHAPTIYYRTENSSGLELSHIRGDLIRQEETIIFALIERAQFAHNPSVYEPGRLTDKFPQSFLDFFLMETEKLHARLRRYNCPDENAFFPEALPPPLLPGRPYRELLKPNRINVNERIKQYYTTVLLPKICTEKEDGEYGSSAVSDISALQALSKRIHYGKFVAEAKFQSDPTYRQLIEQRDDKGLMKLLTNQTVEDKLLERVRLKASTYGQEVGKTAANTDEGYFKVDPQVIVEVYRDFVMPLTKEVQVAYLLSRLDKPKVAYVGGAHSAGYFGGVQHFGSDAVEMVPEPSVVRAVLAVLAKDVNFAVVPIENVVTGICQPTVYQLLETDVVVCGEVYVNEHYVLAVAPRGDSANPTANTANGVPPAQREEAGLAGRFATPKGSAVVLDELRNVYVHSELADECAAMLANELPNATIRASATVAEAARLAREDPTGAAVTLEEAARHHGLSIIHSKLLDDFPSVSRYLILGKDYGVRTGHDKTLLQFTVSNQSGALGAALQAFKAEGINLSSLNSFPSRRDGRQYTFLAQADGHAQDGPLSKAIAALRALTSSMRVLGSFPSQTPPTHEAANT
ncbi:unnamed protein product [Vitrella brassicaformis CCMP3155]|uniref:chorismate mutase n=2 Tax=Vitrella brassicaformis TaxID=1169539 RepID=A0A0G4GLJ8_VITBC|nr:unnamed protein product [Vitrella brassicaformis CCMP3155]|eukprot:CEM30953.1 unnamed protein product [Vitrella brassicaformis CCMP3155]